MYNIKITEESGRVIKSEIEPLLHEHWEEVGHFKDIPLSPDWDLYDTLETKGKFKIFTARVEGKIIGYIGYMMNGHPHYSTTVFAMEDILFVDPEFRKRGLGSHLIQFAETELKKYGAQVVLYHSKLAHDISHLLKSMGCEPIDMILGKQL